MIVNDLLKKENMSRYRLSKESGVAMTTITDICSGKADLDKCAAGTLYKIAKVLGVTVDSILENNSRIQDWIPDGVMAKHFKARYFKENKNATEEKFEACRLDIIKYDEDLKICMQELANILGIEYNPNLK